jgi:hypothetical protein
MTWKSGTRQLKKYNNTSESFEDFKDIWSRLYKVYPTIKEAIKYTGNDNAKVWLNNVNIYFNKC